MESREFRVGSWELGERRERWLVGSSESGVRERSFFALFAFLCTFLREKIVNKVNDIFGKQ